MENTMDEKHTAYPVAGSLTEQERHSIEAFYRAFSDKSPDLLNEAVVPDWQDIPLAPGQRPGRFGSAACDLHEKAGRQRFHFGDLHQKGSSENALAPATLTRSPLSARMNSKIFRASLIVQDRIPVPAIAAATHNLSVPVRLKRRTRLNSAKREIAQVT
jgi:hypothetical protein